MKKYFLKAVLMVLLVLAAVSICCYASEGASPLVVINGVVTEFDVNPIIENGRTLIPVRAVSEKLEYGVEWDEASRRVTIKNGNEILELFIDQALYTKNGVQKQMDVPAKILNGRTLVPLRLVAEEFGCEVNWIGEEYTAQIIKHEVCNVTSAEELLRSIGSYKKIILAPGEYNLSKVSDKIENYHIKTENNFDGNEYIIFETEGLIIEGAEGQTASIVIEPRYANVLRFVSCSNIVLKNITAGHTVEPGYCMGGVIKLDDCVDVILDDCRLYGCGTYGVLTDQSKNINVINTEIYECTYGLIEIIRSENVVFDNCIFRDSEEFGMFSIATSSNVGIYNSTIKNNTSSEYSSFIESYDSDKVHFKNCEFKDNTYVEFTTPDVYFENCTGVEK